MGISSQSMEIKTENGNHFNVYIVLNINILNYFRSCPKGAVAVISQDFTPSETLTIYGSRGATWSRTPDKIPVRASLTVKP